MARDCSPSGSFHWRAAIRSSPGSRSLTTPCRHSMIVALSRLARSLPDDRDISRGSHVMPSTVLRILGLLLCFGVLPPAGADAAEPADLATRFEHYTLGYQVNDDASLVESHDWAMTVLKERAVAQAKRASVTYSTS